MATRLANREACRKEPQKIGKSICICQNHNRSGTPRATPPPAARGPSHALPKAQAHRAPPREAPREERVDAGRYVLARTLTFAIIALVLLGARTDCSKGGRNHAFRFLLSFCEECSPRRAGGWVAHPCLPLTGQLLLPAAAAAAAGVRGALLAWKGEKGCCERDGRPLCRRGARSAQCEGGGGEGRAGGCGFQCAGGAGARPSALSRKEERCFGRCCCGCCCTHAPRRARRAHRAAG